MKNLLIEIDSINWYGTEYWLYQFEGFKLIRYDFYIRQRSAEREEKLGRCLK